MKRILVIIPAYNEQESILNTVSALKNCSFPSEYSVDYIVVNDGSKDDTEKVCIENSCNFISHPVNLGLAGAFQTGMRYAYNNNYDAAIQFDGDGQHNPEYIPKMLQLLENGNDIVIGSRFVNETKPKSLRMLGNNMIQAAIKITTGKRITDPTSGMRLFNRQMIHKLATAYDLGPEPDTIAFLIRSGKKVCECQVKMNERMAGQSYLTMSRSIRYMTHMFVSILFLQWFRRK